MIAIESIKESIEQALADLDLGARIPQQLYGPMGYILGLKAKRIRPLLVALSYHAYAKHPTDEYLPMALAVEIFHNFTLVHDDIMDNAPQRRGQATIHTKWDRNTAILSGDALFCITYELLCRYHAHPAFQSATQLFNRVSLEVCEGQALDMEQSGAVEVTLEGYLEMIRKKTAVLIGGCISLGGLIGGASPETAQLLYQYGELLGIAFQLRDDFLDAFGTTAAIGKQIGGDIIENKNNYLWIQAVAQANAAQIEILQHWRSIDNQPIDKVQLTLAIYHELDLPNDLNNLIADYYTQAESIRAQLESDSQVNFAPLNGFLNHLMSRMS
jgi:geranylgeranyl diphosphate synthase, type II